MTWSFVPLVEYIVNMTTSHHRACCESPRNETKLNQCVLQNDPSTKTKKRALVVPPGNKTVHANNRDNKTTDMSQAALSKNRQRITSTTKTHVSARYRSAERLRVYLDVLSPSTTATILSERSLMNTRCYTLYGSRRKSPLPR